MKISVAAAYMFKLKIQFFLYIKTDSHKWFYTHKIYPSGCPRSVMVKVLDCKIVVSEFVFQSRYYVHFRANILGEGMSPLILPAMG